MSYQYALAAFDLGRWDLARKYLLDELAANPNSADALALFACCDYNQGDRKEAIEHAKAAIAIEPLHDYAYYVLALALNATKATFEAEIAIEEAIRLQPENADYLAAFASFEPVASKKGMELIDRALAADPNHVSALYQKYERLMSANRKQEADAVRQHVLMLNPEDAHMHSVSGWQALENPAAQKEAVDHFHQALRFNPHQRQSVIGLQDAQYQLRHPIQTKLKRLPWHKMQLSMLIPLALSLTFAVVCQLILHIDVEWRWMALGFGLPVVIFLFLLVAEILVNLIYYMGLNVGLPRADRTERSQSTVPGGWRSIAGGIAFGIALIAFDNISKRGGVHLPHWLLSDWKVIFKGMWAGIGLMAPLIFAFAVFGSLFAPFDLIKRRLRGEPLSTRFFAMIWVGVSCLSILLLFALMAAVGPKPWFIVVILAVEFFLIGFPQIPACREFVKRKIREAG